MFLSGVVCVGNDLGPVLGHPLIRSGGTLGKFVFVAEKVFEKVVAPLRGGRRPSYLQAAGDRVRPHSGTVAIVPAETLRCDIRSLGLDADVIGRSRSMRLAERMTTGDQSNGFLKVHRHS